MIGRVRMRRPVKPTARCAWSVEAIFRLAGLLVVLSAAKDLYVQLFQKTERNVPSGYNVQVLRSAQDDRLFHPEGSRAQVARLIHRGEQHPIGIRGQNE